MSILSITFPSDYSPGWWDYVEDVGSPHFDLHDCYNVLFCARSRSGKGVLLNSILTSSLIHWIPLDNFRIFSPTFLDDESYSSFKNALLKNNPNYAKEQVFQFIDKKEFDKVREIQNSKKEFNQSQKDQAQLGKIKAP